MSEDTGLSFVRKFDGGHSLFTDGVGNAYVKDNSNEGPHRVDADRPIIMAVHNTRIPLIGETYTPAPPEEAFFIADLLDMLIETPTTMWKVTEV